MEEISNDVVRQCLGNKFEKFCYAPVNGMRGGILIAWDSSVVPLSNRYTTANTLTTLVSQEGVPHWWLTGVYGPQSDTDEWSFSRRSQTSETYM